MLDSGELRTVDLGAATGLRFPDPQLQQQFKDYLAALAAARSKEKRSVYIDSTDAKERDVTASYMIPAPVWKSSYRLIFGAKGSRCWKAGRSWTTPPARIGPRCSSPWCRAGRFRSSASSMRRSM